MIKEVYKKNIKDHNVKFLSDGTISEYIRKEDVTGLRIYVTGLLGVAGTAKKDYDPAQLERQALENAKHNPYPVDCSHSLQQKIIYNYELSKEKDYKEAMVLFVEHLKNTCSDLEFHGQMSLIDREESLSNEMGLSLQYKDHYIMMNLYFEDAENHTPVPFFYRGRRYSRSVFGECVQTMAEAWKRQVNLQEKTMPVFFSSSNRFPFTYLFEHLNGQKVGEGVSSFSEKINEPLFNPLFTLYSSHDIENIVTPFFDMEGTVVRTEPTPLSPYRSPLIKEGIFVSPYSDKRTARKYGYKLTANAVGSFRKVPFPGISHFQLKSTHESLSDLLRGEVGILVINASKIQHLHDDVYECITKIAFLTDGKNLLGRIPPVRIQLKAMDTFGKDYLGCSKHILFPFYSHDVFGFQTNISVL